MAEIIKKRVNERTVVFKVDYANKSKGLEMKCDAVMASHLVNIAKVAEYKTETPAEFIENKATKIAENIIDEAVNVVKEVLNKPKKSKKK